jgi:hypothetical protein
MITRVGSGRRRLSAAVGLAASVLVFTGCNLHISNNAEAKDEWQRHYTLAPGGTLDIRNTNGLIHIESTDGNAVDVTADRVVTASTDEAAKSALARLELQETISPDRVAIDSSNRGVSFLINMSQRVDYRIRLPLSANIKLETTNGNIEVMGPHVLGTLHAVATNGRIIATGLENSASIETTNGAINLTLTSVGEDGLSCSTTNGQIVVTLPPNANARLSARITNGAIHTEGLALNISEQSRHRLDATMGSGGPAIKLETTNGLIQVKAAK